MEGFIGQIALFAGNFAPRGWALCEGQLLPIQQYSALFTILKTIYGGDGVSTFALPDLRSRVPLGPGQPQGLPQTQPGGQSTVQQGTGDAQFGTLGLNYIICLEGIYPQRA